MSVRDLEREGGGGASASNGRSRRSDNETWRVSVEVSFGVMRLGTPANNVSSP